MSMFTDWLYKLNYVNMIGFIFGSLMMFFIWDAPLMGVLLLVAGVLLIISKLNGRPLIYFMTYLVHLYLIGLLIFELLSIEWLSISPYLFVICLAAMISLIAVIIRSNTSTLTLFWLALHILILAYGFVGGGTYWATVWSPESVQAVFKTFYSILIAFFLIGVFLDRFQNELKREYRDRN
jgi:hypothetical protein